MSTMLVAYLQCLQVKAFIVYQDSLNKQGPQVQTR